MKCTLQKDIFLTELGNVQKFTSSRLNTATALQGVFIKIEKKILHLYATDLNTYCHSQIPLDAKEDAEFIIEPKKIVEFIQFLQPGDITIEIEGTSVKVSQGKTHGVFPIMMVEDFPLPPVIEEESEELSPEFLLKNLPFLLFTASTDDARPVLTGINFVVSDEDLTLVSTDGFRLSLVKEKRKGAFSSMIVPAEFLKEILRHVKEAQKVRFTFSDKERIIRFEIGNSEYYSRLIDGDFPPYERVIPDEKKATVKLKKDELLRNTKLIAIFAREFSNVITYDFSAEGLSISPKKEANAENTTTQDIEFEGEPMKVAFNYKYVIDFLNNVEGDDLEIELLRSDAPVVLRVPGNETFMHIIMPVRIQE